MDLPLGAGTGIGSLPHREVAEALACVAAGAPAFPFWPQLPHRDPAEGMIPQTLGPLRGVALDRLAEVAEVADPALDAERAAGWFGFLDGFADRFPEARAVKGQLAGPLTLAFALLERAPGADDAPLLATLAGWVARCAAWQAERLAALGLPTVVVADEPCLGLPHDLPEEVVVAALVRVRDAVRTAGAGFGVHCCSPPPCDLLSRVGIDLLAFDADHGLEGFADDPDARALHDAGTWIVWGLVPTDRSLPDTTATIADRWGRVGARQLWITTRCLFGASCGLAGLDPGGALRALAFGERLRDTLGSVQSGEEHGVDSSSLTRCEQENSSG